MSLTPSLWIFSIHGVKPSIIHLLEDNEIKPNQSNSYEKVLIETIKCHQRNLKNYIINNYFNENEINKNIIYHIVKSFNYESFPSDFDDYFKIDFIIKSKNFPLFQVIQKHQKIDLNLVFDISDLTFSILHYSVRCNNIELTQYLLKQSDVDMNKKTHVDNLKGDAYISYQKRYCEYIETPLNQAIRYNKDEIILLMMNSPMIDVNAVSNLIENVYEHDKFKYADNLELTPLQTAIIMKRTIIVKTLLENSKININQKTTYQEGNGKYLRNAFHIAILYNCTEIVNFLIKCPDIDVNEKLIYKYYSSTEYGDGYIDSEDEDNYVYYQQNFTFQKKNIRRIE